MNRLAQKIIGDLRRRELPAAITAARTEEAGNSYFGADQVLYSLANLYDD